MSMSVCELWQGNYAHSVYTQDYDWQEGLWYQHIDIGSGDPLALLAVRLKLIRMTVRVDFCRWPLDQHASTFTTPLNAPADVLVTLVVTDQPPVVLEAFFDDGANYAYPRPQAVGNIDILYQRVVLCTSGGSLEQGDGRFPQTKIIFVSIPCEVLLNRGGGRRLYLCMSSRFGGVRTHTYVDARYEHVC